MALMLSHTYIKAQITKTDNIATAGIEYCGWDGTGG